VARKRESPTCGILAIKVWQSDAINVSAQSNYWSHALRFYAKAAFVQSAVVWGTALLVPPVLWLLHGAERRSLRGALVIMAVGLAIGAGFFGAMLGTAIGHDLLRNRAQTEPLLEYNPLLFWKVFLYAGCLMFLAAAFLSYRQGWWLSVEFGGFTILCWFGARSLAVRVRVPKKRPTDKTQTDANPDIHKPKLKHWVGGHLQPGFVAMEYYALILNRSFLVFITDEGLRVWKFCGSVSSFEPLFYEPAEALLDDPEMTPGSPEFEKLMHRRHTFHVPYPEIRSVTFEDRQKWGMDGIPHVGMLRLEFRTHRRTREFILLGNAHGQLIRDTIVSKLHLR
jgi:hypothetical protein